MQPRQFWKGYLRLSLVTCPVALSPASGEQDKVRFHTLNRETGDRVVSRYVDSVTGKPVADDDQARGYERAENDFVLLDDDELEAVAIESVRTIDILSFVPVDSIDWLWWESAYFLTPDDPVGVEAYCVIRDAMRAERVAAISRLVLKRRERAVLLLPRDAGIVLWTLRYGEEVRDSDDYFDDAGVDRRIDAEPQRLVAKLIAERKRPWSADMAEDPVQSRFLELIERKRKGARPLRRPNVDEEQPPNNVVSIMDALRRSVAAGRGGNARRPRP